MIRVLIQACLLTTVLHFTFANEKIVITGNDTMQFSTREFSVPAGKKVELEFKNIGKLPKIAMGHNLVILKEGVSAPALARRFCKLVAMRPMRFPSRLWRRSWRTQNFWDRVRVKPLLSPRPEKREHTNLSAPFRVTMQ